MHASDYTGPNGRRLMQQLYAPHGIHTSEGHPDATSRRLHPLCRSRRSRSPVRLALGIGGTRGHGRLLAVRRASRNQSPSGRHGPLPRQVSSSSSPSCQQRMRAETVRVVCWIQSANPAVNRTKSSLSNQICYLLTTPTRTFTDRLERAEKRFRSRHSNPQSGLPRVPPGALIVYALRCRDW